MSKTRDEIRQEFIKNDWFSYPECPRGFLQYGRVYQMRLGNYQLADFKIVTRPTSATIYKGSDILVDGDLIALMPAGLCVLMAPNLTNYTGFHPLPDHPWMNKKNYYEFLYYVRNFFNEKKFLECKTPTLVECPGTEPSLDPFETEFIVGSFRQKYYLPTSPELHLKKLLSMGAEKIFEIAPVFRNGEKTDIHHFEFQMLEWYRAMSYLSHIKHDVIELVEYLADRMKCTRPKEVVTYTMEELFKEFCHFELTPLTTENELKNLAEKLDIDVRSAQCIDDYFYLIFLEKIENKWPSDRLVFVEKYPPYQAALARIDKNGWAERFEVYWKGLEIGNAFHELNDPHLQKLRSLEDLEKKKLMGKKNVTLDEEFLWSLEFGMPPSSGIAIGLERLYMALKNVKSIDSLVVYSKFKQFCGK